VSVMTEAELREMWQAGRGAIPPMSRQVRFTPSARDFIHQWNIEISYVDAVSASEPPQAAVTHNSSRPAWDKPGEFPVRLEGSLPVCSVCGQPIRDKPSHMSQLDPGHFAPKTAPRFLFRGKMDTLHAQFLVAMTHARRSNLAQLVDYLTTLAAYCREITSAEYNEREVAPLQLAGQSEAAIRERTHWPEQNLGIKHVVPGPDDHDIVLQLNLLRCQVRETELAAANVFIGPDGQPVRPDLMRALNRLSSAVYYLILLFKAGKIVWKLPGRPEQRP